MFVPIQVHLCRLSIRNIGYQCRIGSSALLGEATLAVLMFVGNRIFMSYLGDDGVGLFISLDSGAARIAIDGFPYFATGFIFFIVNISAVGYFQSVERIKPATTFALLRGFVFLIPSFILLPKLMATSGIWLALPLSEVLTTVVILCATSVKVVYKRRYA